MWTGGAGLARPLSQRGAPVELSAFGGAPLQCLVGRRGRPPADLVPGSDLNAAEDGEKRGSRPLVGTGCMAFRQFARCLARRTNTEGALP